MKAKHMRDRSHTVCEEWYDCCHCVLDKGTYGNSKAAITLAKILSEYEFCRHSRFIGAFLEKYYRQCRILDDMFERECNKRIFMLDDGPIKHMSKLRLEARHVHETEYAVFYNMRKEALEVLNKKQLPTNVLSYTSNLIHTRFKQSITKSRYRLFRGKIDVSNSGF